MSSKSLLASSSSLCTSCSTKSVDDNACDCSTSSNSKTTQKGATRSSVEAVHGKSENKHPNNKAKGQTPQSASTVPEGGIKSAAQKKTIPAIVEDLQSSKRGQRESALAKLATLLRAHSQEVSDTCAEHLVEVLISMIKKGNSVEGVQAARVLTLTLFTLGHSAGALLLERLDVLFLQLQTNEYEAVRVRLAETITVGMFASPSRDTETANTMARFSKCFGPEEKSYQVVCACIDGWAFLATLVPEKILLSKKMLTMCMPVLIELLEHANSGVRVSAGEALAILYEARWKLLCSQMRDDDNTDDRQTEGSEPLTLNMLTPVESIDDEQVLITMQRLAIDNSKKMSRTEREHQHQVFLAVCKTVESGGCAPEDFASVGARRVEVRTWADRSRMTVLKNALQGGFKAHMTANVLLHGLFKDVELSEESEDEEVVELELPPARPMCHRQKFLVHESKKKQRAKKLCNFRDDHSRRMHEAVGEFVPSELG